MRADSGCRGGLRTGLAGRFYRTRSHWSLRYNSRAIRGLRIQTRYTQFDNTMSGIKKILTLAALVFGILALTQYGPAYYAYVNFNDFSQQQVKFA